MWEKEKLLVKQAISPFLTVFSTLYNTYFSFQMHFKMSSAICFNLDQSKTLSSANRLTLYQNEKILDWSKLKAFADNKIKFNATEKLKFLLERVENTGKRKKCWLPAFSPFPTMFSKEFLYSVVKSGLCGKELTLCQTSPGFYLSPVQVFWKHCGKKRRNWFNEQFLLFPQCFLPFQRTFCHFYQIWNRHLQALSVWGSLKFIIW